MCDEVRHRGAAQQLGDPPLGARAALERDDVHPERSEPRPDELAFGGRRAQVERRVGHDERGRARGVRRRGRRARSDERRRAGCDDEVEVGQAVERLKRHEVQEPVRDDDRAPRLLADDCPQPPAEALVDAGEQRREQGGGVDVVVRAERQQPADAVLARDELDPAAQRQLLDQEVPGRLVAVGGSHDHGERARPVRAERHADLAGLEHAAMRATDGLSSSSASRRGRARR